MTNTSPNETTKQDLEWVNRARYLANRFADAALHLGSYEKRDAMTQGYNSVQTLNMRTEMKAKQDELMRHLLTRTVQERRWGYVNKRAHHMKTSRYEALCELLAVRVDEDFFDLGMAIDEAEKTSC